MLSEIQQKLQPNKFFTFFDHSHWRADKLYSTKTYEFLFYKSSIFKNLFYHYQNLFLKKKEIIEYFIINSYF